MLTLKHTVESILYSFALLFLVLENRHHPPDSLNAEYPSSYITMRTVSTCGGLLSLTGLLCLVMDSPDVFF